VSHQKYIDAFAAFIGRQRDVLECHHVTGEESFILKVKTANTDSLEKLLADVRSLEGVSGTVTKVVLSSVKESQKLEFDNGFAAHAKKRNGANHRKTGTGS
jgi:Lrp/AsnC family leucine-responsive transcriptional regulator